MYAYITRVQPAVTHSCTQAPTAGKGNILLVLTYECGPHLAGLAPHVPCVFTPVSVVQCQ